MTPLEVWRRLDRKYRETSVRRAITNLTPDFLLKTDVKVEEEYGGMNYKWKLKIEKQGQQELF